MKEDIKKLQDENKELNDRVLLLEETVRQLADTKLKTSAREIINHEVQFLQKAYDKDGNLIPEINA